MLSQRRRLGRPQAGLVHRCHPLAVETLQVIFPRPMTHDVDALVSPSTRSGLVATGRDRAFGDRLVTSGRLVRAAPSTYLPVPASLLQRIQAALAHTGPGAVITGWAACEMHGMRYVQEQLAIPVLVHEDRRLVSTPWVQVLRSERRPRWKNYGGGFMVAAPARAVVDAARQAPDLRTVRALVLSAIGDKHVTEAELREELDAGPRHVSGLCRWALDDARRGAASAPECEMADEASRGVRRGVLPPFLLNPELWVSGVLLAVLDGYVVGSGVGWETDSDEFHDEPEDADATRDRSTRVAGCGIQLVHASPRQMRRNPAHWLDGLVGAVRARRASGYREPSELVVVRRGPLCPIGARQLRVLRDDELRVLDAKSQRDAA